MARSVRLQFFAGFRFVAVVFNKAGVRGDPLALTSIQSLPGQMLRFSKAHEVGRPPLAREFQGGAGGGTVECWMFAGSPSEAHYTARRIVHSYTSAEALPLDLAAVRSSPVMADPFDPERDQQEVVAIALDSVVLHGATCEAIEDVPPERIPEWMSSAFRPRPSLPPPLPPRAEGEGSAAPV